MALRRRRFPFCLSRSPFRETRTQVAYNTLYPYNQTRPPLCLLVDQSARRVRFLVDFAPPSLDYLIRVREGLGALASTAHTLTITTACNSSCSLEAGLKLGFSPWLPQPHPSSLFARTRLEEASLKPCAPGSNPSVGSQTIQNLKLRISKHLSPLGGDERVLRRARLRSEPNPRPALSLRFLWIPKYETDLLDRHSPRNSSYIQAICPSRRDRRNPRRAKGSTGAVIPVSCLSSTS